MLTHRSLWPATLAAVMTFGLASAALAEEPQAPAPVEAMATLHWSQPAAAPQVQAASDAVLDDASGRGTENNTVALTEQSLSAVNTGNTIQADNVTSGAISLQDNAFSSFSGIGNLQMNTGNNNNLTSNISVTVIVTP